MLPEVLLMLLFWYWINTFARSADKKTALKKKSPSMTEGLLL